MSVEGIATVAGILLLLGGFIYRMTKRRDKWGLNVRHTACPQCGEPVPMIRNPKSLKQAMWGGHTCSKCGTEMDKWGRELAGK